MKIRQSYPQFIRYRNFYINACRIVGVLSLVLAMAGCFNARIGTGATSVDRRDTTMIMASYLWGAVMDERMIRKDSLNAYSDIEITQDFGQVAVSLVTLGMYVPVTAHCYFESCGDGDHH